MMKHRNICKRVSLLVCLSLLLALLPACSTLSSLSSLSGGGKSAKPEDLETSIDITEIFNEELESAFRDNEELLEYLKVNDFSIDVTVSMDDDGAYQLTVDERALEKTVRKVIESLKDGAEQYQEEQVPDGAAEAARFAGSWECSLDLTDLVNEEMAEGIGDEDLAYYFYIDNFSLKLALTLREDRTFRLAVDKTALERSFDGVIDTFRAGLIEYLEDLIWSEGLDMTVDELLASEGYDMDSFLDEVLDMADFDYFMSSMDSLDVSGTFEAEDDVLSLTANGVTETLRYTQGRLTMDGDNADRSDPLYYYYPLVFTKK